MGPHEDPPVQAATGKGWRVQPWYQSDLSRNRRVAVIRPPGRARGLLPARPPRHSSGSRRLLREKKNTIK